MNKRWKRRQFLAVAASGPALGLGCARVAPAPSVTMEEVERFVLAIGPWASRQADEQGLIERFADKFWNDSRADSKRARNFAQVVRAFSELPPKRGSLDMSGLKEEAQEMLLGMVEALYSYSDVRYFINGMPPAGRCGAKIP